MLPELTSNGGATRPVRVPDIAEAEDEMERARRFGARFVAIGEADYPPMLRNMALPPPLIAVKGETEVLQLTAIGIVGARNASLAGIKMARMLARDLGAEGYSIVSGLARGIDAAAHVGSLDTGTVAMMAGGLDRPYPPENVELAEEIAERGALVSEMPFGWEPRARDFPRRNRLVAGLSLGLIVVEAANRSGSLISARLAGEMGRIVFAVPGSPLDPRAAGSNRLLKDGAVMVTEAQDVITHIAPSPARPSRGCPLPSTSRPTFPPRRRRATTSARWCSRRLGPTPVSIDEIVRHTGTFAGPGAPHSPGTGSKEQPHVMDVVIVESPAKAKTINKYLGSGLQGAGIVRPCARPARQGRFGRPDEDFAMSWEVDGPSSKRLSEIAKAVKEADSLILATDPDREGEAISWHVLEVLRQKRALKDKPVKRVVFNAITKQAVTEAMAARARSTRRWSTPIWRAARSTISSASPSRRCCGASCPARRSAGRVQSVALRLVCDRETEIERFIREDYWQIAALLKTPRGEGFEARLTAYEGKKLQKLDHQEPGRGRRHQGDAGGASFKAASVEAKPTKRNPAPPFTTSTLQQAASSRLGFGVAHHAGRAAAL
jgi:DNA processing protein